MPIEDLRELYASTFNGPILSTTKQEEMSTSSEHSTEQEEGHDYQSLTIVEQSNISMIQKKNK